MKVKLAIAAVAVVVLAGVGLAVTVPFAPSSGPCGDVMDLPDVGRGAGEVSDTVDGCVKLRKVAGEDAYEQVLDDLGDLDWDVDDLGYAAKATREDGDRRWSIMVRRTDGGAELTLSPGLVTTVDEGVSFPMDQPRLHGDLVLLPDEDGVRALDVSSGDERWLSDECPAATWATGVEGPAAPVEVVRCGMDLAGISVEDGSLAWRAPVTFETDRVRSGTRAIVLMGGQRALALDLLTGDKLWELDYADASIGSDDERVYLSTNVHTTAFDLDTGEQVWQLDLRASGLGVGDGALVVRSNSWVVHRLDPATGEDLWESESDSVGLAWSEVVGVTDDVTALMSTQGRRGVSVYSMEDGERLWRTDLGADEPAMASSGGDVVGVWRGSQSVVELRDAMTGSRRADLALASGVASIDGDRVAYLEYGEHGTRLVVAELP